MQRIEAWNSGDWKEPNAWVLYFYKRGGREPFRESVVLQDLNLGHLVPTLPVCVSASIGQVVQP